MKKFLLFLMFALFCIPWAANAQQAIPYSYGFEDNDLTIDGWTAQIETSYSGISTAAAQTGTYGFRFNYAEQSGYLMSPILTGTDAGVTVSFSYTESSSTYGNEQFYVGYTTDETVTDPSEFTYGEIVTASTSWEEYEATFPAGTKRIAIQYVYNDALYLYLDDFSFTAPSSCPKPTALAGTANGQSATLSWTSDASSFAVAHSMDATDDPDDNIVTTVSATTFTMDNLTLDADHYFWVRTNCDNETSAWVGPKSVHIGYCTPAPASVDNDGISNVTFGTGDYVVNNATTNATYADFSTEMIGAVQAGVEATIEITYATGYTYNTYVWVDLDNSLSFDADEVVCYGESTNTNPTTLTLSFIIPADQTLGDYRLRIGGADNGLGSDPNAADPCYTGYYAAFQDYTLRVLEAPACLTPTNVAINYTGGTTAEVTWDGTADSYNIDVNGEVTNNVTTPYALTGLDLSTAYTVKVQANCGSTTSEWSNSVSFTTDACMPEEKITINYALTDSYGDGWNGNAINVVDENCEVIETLTISSGSSATGTLGVCANFASFEWVKGSYPGETSWSFTDANGNTLFSGAGTTSMATGDVLYVINNYPYGQPTDLEASEIGSSKVTLSWTSEDASAWQICLNGDMDNLIDANSNPFTLTGLTPETEYTVKVRATGDEGNGVWSCDEVTFTTLDACPMPTDLAASEIGPNSAVLSWTEIGDATRWTLAWKAAADETYTEFQVTDPTYTLTGLHPETDYNVKVKPRCATGDTWSEEITFTTAESCPAPSDIQITDITAEGATISWTGFSDSYNVCYNTSAVETATFFDGFEDGISQWTTIRGDGGTEYTDWRQYYPAMFSSGGPECHGGEYAIMSRSWSSSAYNVCNWLISPQVTLEGTLKFWALDDGSYHEHYDVYISTTTADTADFQLVYSPGDASDEWTEYTFDLSSYQGAQGYIAFRHQDYDQDYLLLDDIGIYVTGDAGDQTCVTATDATVTLSGLAENTAYDIQIQGFCQDEESEPSEVVSFVTPYSCPAPTDATVTYESGLTAEVNCTSDATAFNVKVNDEVVAEGVAMPYTFDVEYATAYSVEVQAVCDAENVSLWTEAVEFFTDYCPLEDQCEISYTLTTNSTYSSYGWYGSYILVIDNATNTLIDALTEDSGTGTTTGTVSVCDGSDITFQWYSANANNDAILIDSYEILDLNGNEIAAGEGPMSEDVEYTVNCTELNCLRPTDLMVEDTAGAFNVSWTGNSETYTVRYRESEIFFSEEFENGIPETWTNVYAAGDSVGWFALSDVLNYFPDASSYYTDLSGWAYSDSNAVTSASYVNAYGARNVSNWLITPQLDLQGTLKFMVMAQGNYGDEFEVLLSTTTTDTSAFTTVLRDMEAASGSYQQVSIDLSEYAGQQGYIAIHHAFNDGYFLVVDNFGIYGEPSEWQEITVNDTTTEISGLSAGMLCEVQVTGVCDGEEPLWSNIATFTTPEQTTVLQTISLSAGTNWVSFYVETNLDDLKAALVATGNTDITISSQTQSTTYNPVNGRWTGQLRTMDLSQMYIIELGAAGDITLEGMTIDPSMYPATIVPGVNYIAYPFNTIMTVTNAFAGFGVVNDQVQSQEQNANYNGTRWTGQLRNLEPGKGYIYNSASTGTRTFTYPSGN